MRVYPDECYSQMLQWREASPDLQRIARRVVSLELSDQRRVCSVLNQRLLGVSKRSRIGKEVKHGQTVWTFAGAHPDMAQLCMRGYLYR